MFFLHEQDHQVARLQPAAAMRHEDLVTADDGADDQATRRLHLGQRHAGGRAGFGELAKLMKSGLLPASDVLYVEKDLMVHPKATMLRIWGEGVVEASLKLPDLTQAQICRAGFHSSIAAGKR